MLSVTRRGIMPLKYFEHDPNIKDECGNTVCNIL